MKNKICFFMITILALGSNVLGQTSKVGTTGAQFLKIGVGPRAVAMGEAFAGRADDATAVYWNPGGLAFLKKKEAFFLHSQWLADIKFNFAALILPLNVAGTAGVFVSTLGVPEDKVRTVLQPEGTGEQFDALDLTLGLSYARNLTDKLTLGINVKYIQQRIWTMSASAWALDVGTIYQTPFKNLRLGICLTNFGTQLQMRGRATQTLAEIDPSFTGDSRQARAYLDTDNWELPMGVRLGVSLDLVHNETMRLTLATDAIQPNDNQEYLNSGLEYGIKELVFIRGGFRGLGMEQMEGGLTLGGGLRVNPGRTMTLKLDYAYVDYGRLDMVHRYALAVEF